MKKEINIWVKVLIVLSVFFALMCITGTSDFEEAKQAETNWKQNR